MNILNHYPAITSRAQTYKQTTLSNNATPPTDGQTNYPVYLSVPTLVVFAAKTPPHYYHFDILMSDISLLFIDYSSLYTLTANSKNTFLDSVKLHQKARAFH